MPDRNDAIETLNDLIETCRNGERGFRAAAERVDNPAVRSLFTDYSSERQRFASELQEEVRRLGGNPKQGDTIAGELHRTWMEVKDDLGGSDATIISEAERGEDVAVSTYRKALDHDLPVSSRHIVERQYEEVRQAHDRVRELERLEDRER